MILEPTERLKRLLEGRSEMAELAREALEAVARCSTLAEVEEVRVRLLGKKGSVSGIFREMAGLPDEEKPRVGEIGNLLRRIVSEELERKAEHLKAAETMEMIKSQAIDVTLPGRRLPQGHRHLLSQVMQEVVDIFLSLGYRVEIGPEVELDYYNFEALNTPAYHPARSLQDTLYVWRNHPERDDPGDVLLRTHTSPVQVRVMESNSPPLYVVSPGRAYRRDEIDATHSAVFHQVEGFAVDRHIHMGHLKGTLEAFARKFFGAGRRVRFRPHFFPFTEPSAEVDVSCFACDVSGCSLCKGTGWLEILGSGMIDPNVFLHVGYDPEEYSGFAFGLGIERVAMMKYGVEDMRVFYENDLRFLRQY